MLKRKITRIISNGGGAEGIAVVVLVVRVPEK